MSESVLSKQEILIFKEIIKDKQVLIVDTVSSTRQTISRLLIELGAKVPYVHFANSIDDALKVIQQKSPHIVVTDYNLDGRTGMELLWAQKQFQPDTAKSLFILVTGNTSETTIAEAAEEEVDAYILKPFTLDSCRLHIVRGYIEKMRPDGFRVIIANARESIEKKNFDEAKVHLKKAREQQPFSPLVCYYEGLVLESQGKDVEAEPFFRKGLEINPLHYKCAIALFDLLVRCKKETDAYVVIREVSKNFPLNQSRLAKVLELAVRTKHFEDITRFYEMYRSIEEKRDDFKRRMFAALAVTAQFMIRAGQSLQSLEIIQKACQVAAGNPAQLRELVLILCERGKADMANEVLKKFPPEIRGGADYYASEYSIENIQAAPEQLVHRGRTLIKKGIEDPLIYKILIIRSKEVNYVDAAEALMHDAIKRWPDKEQFFKNAFDGPKGASAA